MEEKRFSWGIREKLTLLFFGVTFIAVATNFLIVVPRLEAQLRGNKETDVKRAAELYGPLFQQYESLDQQLTSPQTAADFIANNVDQSAVDRVAILLPVSTGLPDPLSPEMRVLVDSSGMAQYNEVVDDWVARRAITTGRSVNGVIKVAGRSHTESATPIAGLNGQTIGAAVFSSSLTSVNSVVKQQARRYLVAAIFALGISLIVGLFASSFIARRIKRLERAARSVAGGNFTEPLVVDSMDELGQLAQAFNNMQERLGRADRARKAFIANASHELRTPLFSLGGYVELLREEDLDDQTQREFLDTMHDQIARLTKLATDLLDLSRIDAGSLEVQFETVDVSELAHGVAREFGPIAVRRDSAIDVEAEPGLNAHCDPDRAAQVMRILIDNALSHTPHGTNIRVGAERQDGMVSLSVHDGGSGISPEDLPRIFDRFHTGNKSGGTGLGLSIANELASAMNGRLSVRSQPGDTTFILDLPPAADEA
jgi:signal transduction histidine kinase